MNFSSRERVIGMVQHPALKTSLNSSSFLFFFFFEFFSIVSQVNKITTVYFDSGEWCADKGLVLIKSMQDKMEAEKRERLTNKKDENDPKK